MIQTPHPNSASDRRISCNSPPVMQTALPLPPRPEPGFDLGQQPGDFQSPQGFGGPARRQRTRFAEKGLERVQRGEGFKDRDIIRCTDLQAGFGTA